MTLLCRCGFQLEHPALQPCPRTCPRCGRCWRCGQPWPALCRCAAGLFPRTLQEALGPWWRASDAPV
jgi:hypothetical protein